MNYRPQNSLRKGFSLVEMLIVIAVIGIIAGIAIPQVGSLNQAATSAKDQRNAETIVSVYQAGVAAGVAWNTTSAATAIANVIAGGTPTSGPYAGKVFQAPDLTGTDVTGASAYITLTNSGLVYR